MKKRLSITILLILSGFNAFSDDAIAGFFETSAADYCFTPGIDYPLEFGQVLLTLGGRAELSARLPFIFAPAFCLDTALAYSLIFVRAENSLSILKASAGAGADLELDPRLILKAGLRGGIHFGFFNTTAVDSSGVPLETQLGTGPLIEADAEIDLYLTPAFSLGINIGYSNSIGLYQGLSAGISTVLNIEGFERKIELQNTPLQPVFPALGSFYAENSSGTITITNGERFPIENLRIYIYIEEYTDGPSVCFSTDRLAPGEQTSGPVFLLLNSKVLEQTEDKNKTLFVKAEYSLNGETQTAETSEKIFIYNRNAISWRDDRAAAAFIYGKHPDSLEWAGSAALAASTNEVRSPSGNIGTALALFSMLKIYGLSYVVDPETLPYEKAVEQTGTVDFIQYPLQTLRYRGGDCDDLTVLYCSLLEAAGIETAMITLPGHIMPAFALKMTGSEAKRRFPGQTSFISEMEKIWVPVEITMLKDSFLDAWNYGSSEWQKNLPEGGARLYPVREAWKTYPPSAGPKTDRIPPPAADERLAALYSEEMSAYIDRVLEPQVEGLRRLIATSNRPEKAHNSLGALYARWGLFDEAEREFRSAIDLADYLPAVINLGNLYYLKKDYDAARQQYLKAEAARPGKASILIALARTNLELGRIAESRKYYASAELADSSLAASFAYLAGSGSEEGRAAAAGSETLIWEEEE